MGQQHNTHIANDTDDNLTVKVEFSGGSLTVGVGAHQCRCVETDFYQPIGNDKREMGAIQDKTHIANATDDDLEVFVEYSGKSIPLIVPSGQYQCVDTDVRANFGYRGKAQVHAGGGVSSRKGPQGKANGSVDGGASFTYAEPGKVRVTIRGPSGQQMREIQSDRSIVVQKRGSHYMIHFAKYGKIWQTE